MNSLVNELVLIWSNLKGIYVRAELVYNYLPGSDYFHTSVNV